MPNLNSLVNLCAEKGIETKELPALDKTALKILEWLRGQKDKAKLAWGVIVVITGLLGYQVTITQAIDNKEPVNTITKTVNDELAKRLELIEKQLNEIKTTKVKPQVVPG